jgi:hypothetical protein
VSGEFIIYPKPLPDVQTVDVYTQPTATGTEICYRSPVDIGGLLMSLELDGAANDPIPGLPIGDMQIQYALRNNFLGMLIYDEEGDVIPAGEGVLFTIPGNGSAEVSMVDASDWSGQVLRVNLESLPGQFQLSQNRPNPFNMSTEISFSLSSPAQWKIDIFNIAGQVIREYSGYEEAGQVSVIWDGCDNAGNPVASGIYLYRARAGDQSQTRKMSLLK